MKLVSVFEYYDMRNRFVQGIKKAFEENPCNHNGSRSKALLDQILECPACGDEVRSLRDEFENSTCIEGDPRL